MKNLLIFVLSFMLIAAIPMTVSAADVEKDGDEQAKNTAGEFSKLKKSGKIK